MPGPGHFRREGASQALLTTSYTRRLTIVIFHLTFDFSLPTWKTSSIGSLELIIKKFPAAWRSLLLIVGHNNGIGFFCPLVSFQHILELEIYRPPRDEERVIVETLGKKMLGYCTISAVGPSPRFDTPDNGLGLPMLTHYVVLDRYYVVSRILYMD